MKLRVIFVATLMLFSMSALGGDNREYTANEKASMDMVTTWVGAAWGLFCGSMDAGLLSNNVNATAHLGKGFCLNLFSALVGGTIRNERNEILYKTNCLPIATVAYVATLLLLGRWDHGATH